MLRMLMAAVQETEVSEYSTQDLILFLGVPIVVVAGILLALRRGKRGC